MFDQKSVLIVGFGREGMSTLTYVLKHAKVKALAAADRKTLPELSRKARRLLNHHKNILQHFGQNYLSQVHQYDVIIKTPGIPNRLLEERLGEKRKDRITSQTKLFFTLFPGTIVGITGTKGKSTTTKLMYDILKQAKKEVVLVGNIGKPALSVLEKKHSPQTVAVYELSSHQLADLTHSPHIAVLLNIYPEHLDYYQSLRQYRQAKVNITKFQNPDDYLIINPDETEVMRHAKTSKAKKVYFSLTEKKHPGAYQKGNTLIATTGTNVETIIKVNDIPLKGVANRRNVLAAIAAAKVLGVTTQTIKTAIKNFKPLPHRLEYVGTYRDIAFYNDSLATIPEATSVALNALKNVETLLLGGSDRHRSFDNLAKHIGKTNVKTAILFPTTGSKIATSLKKFAPQVNRYPVNTMDQAIRIAFATTSPGKVCLMSPASPSFSLFKNYQDRGEQFRTLVKDYAQTTKTKGH